MMRSFIGAAMVAALSLITLQVHAFTVTQSKKSHVLFASGENESEPNKKGFFANFFEELDAFVDDATSRRLGAGSAFYGKRKSNFYGNDDKGRKRDRDMPDPMGAYKDMRACFLCTFLLLTVVVSLPNRGLSRPRSSRLLQMDAG
jgi:hypothetical protein